MGNNVNPPKSFLFEQSKDTKIDLLIKYISDNKYIEINKQKEICSQFGLPYLKAVFAKVYRERFYVFLEKQDKPTTVATVSKAIGIPHNFLTWCKDYYEKKGLLQVVFLAICPTTKRRNVQFVSVIPAHWNDKRNNKGGIQYSLWEGEND